MTILNFVGWSLTILRKRDHIISAVNPMIQKSNHNYGIKVPISVEHADKIDDKNGNCAWKDEIGK